MFINSDKILKGVFNMSRVKSVYKAIEKVELNKYYSITLSQLQEIRECARGYFGAIGDSFTFGYLQGMKAAKAEMKKKGDKLA